MRKWNMALCLLSGNLILLPLPAAAQIPLDRADPTIAERTLPAPAPAPDTAAPSTTLTLPTAAPTAGDVTPKAIRVVGATAIPPAAFADAIVSHVGHPLSRNALSDLAGAISTIARKQGYPFATATIPPQAMPNGVLQVMVDEGRVDALRVVGAINPAADRILAQTLVTGRPTRQSDLERAILLVGDLPGVTVVQSRFVRQEGFGILLVTIRQQRFSAYAQVDNRGSKEIGPIRSTVLANVNGIARAGDEFGLILAQTPLQSSEFIFLRGRYGMPVDASGSTVALSASYGRSHPGASLRALDVIGRSVDAAITYRQIVRRSRAHSMSVALEVRTAHIQQHLAGRPIREDRLTTLDAGLERVDQFAKGVLRSELLLTAGLPLRGASHEGDAMTSRADGDARFARASYMVSWTRPLSGRFSLLLSSTGQLASRPLLATAEIGAGGPGYGRAYDYAERTGDQGILGLMEIRYDAGAVIPGVIDRFQIYSSIDGGFVDNLRDGAGGGSLLSSSLGARLGKGRFDAMIEISAPMNADRFDTRNREPRIALRLARIF